MKPYAGPSFFQNIRYLSAFKKHYPNAFLELSKQYGSIYRIHLPFKAIFAGEPKLIDYVLRKNAKNYIKGKLYKPLRPVLGNGLVTSEGEEWKKSRKTIAPEFHPKSINAFVPAMIKHTHALTKNWTNSQSIDLSDSMMGLTLAIVGEAFFGDSLGSQSGQIADNLYILLDHSLKKTLNVFNLPDAIPTKQNKRAHLAAINMDLLVLDLIQKRKYGLNQDRRDVLSRLLLAKEIDDVQLLDEVKTLILAGHETTSLALTWCWYLLAKNPEVEKKLHAEVDSVDPTDIEKLIYTRQVILETLRLYPPIPVISRQAMEDDEYEGVFIPKGSLVQLAPYVTHRDPRFWERPEEFIPDRFLNRVEDEGLTYFPFAAGARACIGEQFAMTEAVVILATMASQFRFHLKYPEKNIESEAINTLRLVGGLPVIIEKRT